MWLRTCRAGVAGLVTVVLLGACTTDNASSPATPHATRTPSDATSSPAATTSDQPTDTTQTTASEPRKITVVMNGDMLLHEGLWSTAEIDAADTGRGQMDFRPLLADMRPVISGADLAICHMETPLAPRGGPYSGYPLFSAPPSIVAALKWDGYDACTTASNHSLDQGFDGLTRTLEFLDQAGIAHAGTAATRKASREPLLLHVGDVTVGLVSATYGTNGIPLPADEPWSVPIINTTKIERMAARARAEGADLVMVALHWGLEYMHDPTTDQLAVAEELTNSPNVDFVYGHHAHVVQPYDKLNGKWVVFGLGNAVAQQDTAVEGVYDGNTCRVTFAERPDGSFRVARLEYIPTMITHFDGVHPMRWLNVPKDVDDPAFASLQGELRATGERVKAVIGSRGAFRRGVTEGE
ncbi:MAG: CapA family protein [Nocardioidaceae bacterium]